jgi:hypothetical protein
MDANINRDELRLRTTFPWVPKDTESLRINLFPPAKDSSKSPEILGILPRNPQLCASREDCACESDSDNYVG